MFLFLASFPSAANRFLLKRSAYGKISGPPKSPRCSDSQIPLDYFWKLLPVCQWVSREKCPLVPAQSWGNVQTLIIAPDELLFMWYRKEDMDHESPPGARPAPLLAWVMSCSQHKQKHRRAQQWRNLSLGPGCPAVVAPRLCADVF